MRRGRGRPRKLKADALYVICFGAEPPHRAYLARFRKYLATTTGRQSVSVSAAIRQIIEDHMIFSAATDSSP